MNLSKRFVSPPVHHASTILFNSFEQLLAAKQNPLSRENLYYGRVGTPTTHMLEDAICALDNSIGAVLFPSGVSAISSVILAMVVSGDHVLIADTVYGPTREFCQHRLANYGVDVTYYDPMIGTNIADLIRKNTKLIFLESPGTLSFEVQDIATISQIAKKHNVSTAIDNSWATCYFLNPFDLGIDIHIQAATKYFSGHSDVMAGVVTCQDHELLKKVRQCAFEFGLHLAPDDCYLLYRGLQTLNIRLEQHQKSALELAHWLSSLPEVETVLHPALPSCPGHEFWKRDFKGSSGLFSVQLKNATPTAISAMIDSLTMFGIGFSWGGYESLILPAELSSLRSATNWPKNQWVLRLQIGLEPVEKLKEDLASGFERYTNAK